VKSFDYLRPQSLDELLSLVRTHGQDARILAGGTDLIVRIKKGQELPRFVLDVKRVAELDGNVAISGSSIRIGARAVMTDIVGNATVQQHFPALVEAALVVGSIQIRNRATLAGNICNASPAADTAPALLAYGARVNLLSDGGRRPVAVDDFFAGPGRTTLKGGEIVESIDLPLPAEPAGSAFERLTRRHGVDLAIVSVCCVVRASGVARLAFGAVGPRPFAVDTRIDAPLDTVLTLAKPISDLRGSEEYRVAMLPVLARRAMTLAVDRLRDVGAS
jgi:carbon-monoxide dehydrogenase medium subunit